MMNIKNKVLGKRSRIIVVMVLIMSLVFVVKYVGSCIVHVLL